jgi:hypothetical protein
MEENATTCTPSKTETDVERHQTSKESPVSVEKAASLSHCRESFKPTDEQLRTLRHVPGTLPWSAWLVFALTEPLRRFPASFTCHAQDEHELKP